MADDWDGAVKEAKKILGDKAEIPKIPGTIDKAKGAQDKGYDEYKKIRDQLEAAVLKLQDSDSSTKDAIVQFHDKIEDADFGLDEKNKDDAKKIAQGQKILTDFLQNRIDICDTNIKNLRELNKHLDSLSKYKQSA